jgi:predicted ATPase
MRIAFSGAHRVGKSTLMAAVAERLAGHEHVDEPYNLLEEEGYEHADPPALEDFVAQLERSLLALEDSGPNTLFDRCPADVLAYLQAHEDAESFELDEHIERVREAMQTLDLVVFVPIEQPDRIAVAGHEDKRYRARVHKKLERILLDDKYDLGVDTLEVTGDLRARLASVLHSAKAATGG